MRLKRQTRNERFFRVSGLLAGGLLLFLCGNFVNPPKCTYETYADEPVQVGENPVINVTTAGTIALDLAPTSADGYFAASSTGSFSVTTGNNSGYTLKLKSTNNGTDLKNTVNNAYVLESIDEATSAATFSSSSDYNDKWGYLPSYFNSQANNLYQPAPDTTGDTLDVTYVANGSTPNEYTLAIGARADYGTKAGTYNNTFVIEAVANAPLLTINYNGNGRTFGGSATTNVAKYDVATNTSTETRYAHTPNFVDGNSNPSQAYYTGDGYVQTVNIPGASNLNILLSYGTSMEEVYYVCVLEGNNPFSTDAALIDALRSYDTDPESIPGVVAHCFTSDTGYPNYDSVSFDVAGDTATFVFYHNDGPNDDVYGYYATITSQIQTFHNTLVFGNYMTPTLNSGEIFYGWSTAADGGVEYIDGNDIANKFVGQSGDDVTLYALYGSCPVNKICYDDNGANSTTVMGDQNVDTNATEVTLWASNFQRSGYGFLGWSEKANPTIGTDKIYGPMETISWRRGTGLKLYAIWQQAELDGPIGGEEIVYMQDWYSCSSLTQATYDSTTGKLNVSSNSIIVLTDKRDNQAYAVARLADGNCWMIENLRLESEGTVGNNINDPNVTNQSLAQGYGGTPGTYGSFVGLASAESNYFADNTTSNTIYKSDGSKDVYNSTAGTLEDIGTSNSPGYRMPRYEHRNTASPASSPTSSKTNIYSYGNYYTWAAAIANTMHYTSYSASDAAGTSICPSGWRLPMGGRKASVNNSDFWKMSRANIGADPDNFADDNFYYTGNPEGVDASRALRSFPNNFLYSGFFSNSTTSNRGSGGYYWSSSAYSVGNAYSLHLSSSDLNPGTNFYSRFNGFTVRCVVAPSP